MPCGMWDLRSPAGDQTCIPYIGRQILNHWTTREVLHFQILPCFTLGSRGSDQLGCWYLLIPSISYLLNSYSGFMTHLKGHTLDKAFPSCLQSEPLAPVCFHRTLCKLQLSRHCLRPWLIIFLYSHYNSQNGSTMLCTSESPHMWNQYEVKGLKHPCLLG